MAANPGANLVTTPPDIPKGISPKRQWILEHAAKQKAESAVMMDDDLHFAERRKDDPTKFTRATPQALCYMLNWLARMLVGPHMGGAAHAGIAARQGGNRNTEATIADTRMSAVLGYHVPTYVKLKLRYDRVPVMEDFDVTLQLLCAGYSNILLNSVVQDHGPWNAPGGCSTYRTKELQAQGARQLALLHPGLVRVVLKQAKGKHPWAERTDVVVSWKKARYGKV